jgi:hypothetical protein
VDQAVITQVVLVVQSAAVALEQQEHLVAAVLEVKLLPAGQVDLA